MATKINDTVQFWGNEYIAIPYNKDKIKDLALIDGDKQCRVCQLSDNYCKMKEDCHGEAPFVFVKAAHAKMMENL